MVRSKEVLPLPAGPMMAVIELPGSVEVDAADHRRAAVADAESADRDLGGEVGHRYLRMKRFMAT